MCRKLPNFSLCNFLYFQSYCCVEFLNEKGSIETVPVSWVKNRRYHKSEGTRTVRGRCYWPPKTLKSKLRGLVSKQKKPDPSLWEMHDVEVLGYACKFRFPRRFHCSQLWLVGDVVIDNTFLFQPPLLAVTSSVRRCQDATKLQTWTLTLRVTMNFKRRERGLEGT